MQTVERSPLTGRRQREIVEHVAHRDVVERPIVGQARGRFGAHRIADVGWHAAHVGGCPRRGPIAERAIDARTCERDPTGAPRGRFVMLVRRVEPGLLATEVDVVRASSECGDEQGLVRRRCGARTRQRQRRIGERIGEVVDRSDPDVCGRELRCERAEFLGVAPGDRERRAVCFELGADAATGEAGRAVHHDVDVTAHRSARSGSHVRGDRIVRRRSECRTRCARRCRP